MITTVLDSCGGYALGGAGDQENKANSPCWGLTELIRIVHGIYLIYNDPINVKIIFEND